MTLFRISTQMRLTIRLLIFTYAMAICDASIAAPFCVATNLAKSCWYYDSRSCLKAAQTMKGACVVNSQEVHPPKGGKPFCLVTAVGAECSYTDISVCRTDAQKQKGLCIAH